KDPEIPDVEGPPSLDPDVATQLFLPPKPDVPAPKQPQTAPNYPEIPDVGAATPDPDVEGEDEDFDVATQLFLPPDPDVGSPKTPLTPPEVPDVAAESPDPDVAAQRFPPPNPDVKRAGSPGTAPDPDVEQPSPDPDVGAPPGPAQEGAEAPPTPQVRRSHRLAESRGGGACAGPSLTQGSKPRPQQSRNQSELGIEEAMPCMPIEGNGRGLGSATPPQEEEPAGGAKSRLRPQRATGPAHIRVLFTGLVASPALLVALGSLGGTEATSVHDCSHLVTDGIRRTLKFLCALARGVPIVTPEWLIQSSHGGRPLSPGPFLPRDPSLERRFRFRLRPALARAQGQPLLQVTVTSVSPNV
ncbi:MDC1 protein, partial [Rhabdornis inornatus]|nr:MDC1 protein [Rhabdornis inornatus]